MSKKSEVLEPTEIEVLLRNHPQAAKKFISACSKGDFDYASFSAAERGILVNACVNAAFEPAEETVIKALRDADWIREPVGPEEFLADPKYLGAFAKMIYEPWRKDLEYVLNPENEIFEWVLSGGIGTGKCVHYLSNLFTSSGLLTIQELYQQKNKLNTIQTESGVKPVLEYHNEGLTETIKIETEAGYKLECRPNHRIRIFDGTNIIWKESKDINVGDITLINRKNNVWGNNPYNISVKEAEILGFWTGDGWFLKNSSCKSKPCGLGFVFGNEIYDIDHYHYIKTLLENEYALDVKERKYTNLKLNMYNTKLCTKWKTWGVTEGALNKCIPLAIRQGTKEVVCAFIKGLLDADGHVKKDTGSIIFTTISKILAEQLHLLLLNLGIKASRIIRAANCMNNRNNKIRYEIQIHDPISIKLYQTNIGFNHGKKKIRLDTYVKEKNWSNPRAHEIIPISNSLLLELRKNLKFDSKTYNKIRDRLRHNRGLTYHIFDQIVEIFGEQYLTPLLLKIYKERYIFSPVTYITQTTGYCYDITVKDDPSYISNGFISHNTKASILAQLYKLYRLTCLRNIKAYYDLDPSTKICLGLFTLSLGKAETALAGDFRQLVSMSPYFRSIFPLKKMRTFKKVMNTQGDVKEDNYEVTLPQGLHILMGSKVSHALSLAVISGILDEMNFRTKRTVKADEDEDSAEALYNELNTRIKSRFNVLGHTPGILCVISSKRSSSDFLEAHMAKIKNDPHVLVSSYSQWDVKPNKYSKEKFYVFIGNSKTASRVLSKEELTFYSLDSPNILAVPETLRRDFELDINSALRQHAGVATSPTQLLFEDPVILRQCWDTNRVSPFPTEDIPIGVKNNIQIKDFLNFPELCTDAGFTVIPKHHPSMLRVMHIDLSKSKDSTGIAMGGVSCIKEVVTRNSYGKFDVSSYIPEVWIDFVIGLKANQGDQIDYEKIQQFINYLRSCKFRIHLITMDQYQGVGLSQSLMKDSFTVDQRSVDKDDIPYSLLREIITSKNISMYRHPMLEKELMNLIHDLSRGKGRTDHPKMNSDGTPGSKDKCLTGDTKIKLLDGRCLSFIELIAEFGTEKPIYLYTIKDNKITVGIGKNPRLTKQVDQLIEIELDNNEKIKCTLDHKFLLRDGTYKEAQYLQPEDSLMPLYTKISSVAEKKDMCGYELYYCPSDDKWHYTHRMVGKWKYPSKGYTGNNKGVGLIHHAKGKLNNSPEDIIWCRDVIEHNNYHKTDKLNMMSNEETKNKILTSINYARSCRDLNKLKEMGKVKMENLWVTQREAMLKGCSNAIGKVKEINLEKAVELKAQKLSDLNIAKQLGCDKDTLRRAVKKNSIPWESSWEVNIPIEEALQSRKEGLQDKEIAIKYNCSLTPVKRIFKLAKQLGYIVPPNNQCRYRTVIDMNKVDLLLSQGKNIKEIAITLNANYNTLWFRLTNRAKYKNHKVKNVTILNEKADMYDITVEATHNFALATGIFVHNSDSLAGCVSNAFEIITNVKKFPHTANVDIASKIISNLYPDQKASDLIHPMISGNEAENLTEYTDKANPFKFKLG